MYKGIKQVFILYDGFRMWLEWNVTIELSDLHALPRLLSFFVLVVFGEIISLTASSFEWHFENLKKMRACQLVAVFSYLLACVSFIRADVCTENDPCLPVVINTWPFTNATRRGRNKEFRKKMERTYAAALISPNTLLRWIGGRGGLSPTTSKSQVFLLVYACPNV